MAAVNEMRLPDFSVCLQAQAGIMPLKGKCIPRVQRVVLICGGFGRVGAGENNAKFTENCVITLAKVSDFCYNVYRVGIGFDFNFHKKPYYITIL